jgi:hypothetical protein
VVGVRVRDYDVTHGADLAGAKREPDAATVYREAIVDEKGGQTLELRLWSGAARQKSDSHARLPPSVALATHILYHQAIFYL